MLQSFFLGEQMKGSVNTSENIINDNPKRVSSGTALKNQVPIINILQKSYDAYLH